MIDNNDLPDLRQSPFLDAVALLTAQQRHDGSAVDAVLADADPRALATVLGQMLATAVRSRPMTIAEFVEMQIDKTLDSTGDDLPGDLDDDLDPL
jgi:hypothetical protein